MAEEREMPGGVYVVTGANKGIGLAIVQRLLKETKKPSIVYLTARNSELGEKALQEVQKISSPAGSVAKFRQLDITDSESIKSFADYIANEHTAIECLINNAGWAQKGNKFDSEVVRQSLEINYYGTRNVCTALLPLIRTGGRLVNISSSAGKLTNVKSEELKAKLRSSDLTLEKLDQLMQEYQSRVDDNTYAEDWPGSAYGVSKIGVTAMTRVLAREYKGRVQINAAHPGWIRTDMAGPNAPKSVEEGAETPILLALGDIKQSGEFWSDNQVVPW